MNKKHTHRKKLSLNRETVRQLERRDLAGVGGGEYVVSNANSCGIVPCMPSVNQCVILTNFTCMTQCDCSKLLCPTGYLGIC